MVWGYICPKRHALKKRLDCVLKMMLTILGLVVNRDSEDHFMSTRIFTATRKQGCITTTDTIWIRIHLALQGARLRNAFK